MKKSDINALLRRHAQRRLSPTEPERTFVSVVYGSIQDVLGERNCLQIGSYPRFTAIRPLHDLDVLYILGAWNDGASDPSHALDALLARIRREYQNPTRYTTKVSRQTHSVTIQFFEQASEVFSVDIVPAYISGRNEFGEDTYRVPEIATVSRRERSEIALSVQRGEREMRWIKSDPRGYITVATRTNQDNDDFRRSTKIIKSWRTGWKDFDDQFPLKSFHLEQAITRYFHRSPRAEIFDAVFCFFCDLPELIEKPQFPDRADPEIFIDSYIAGLTRGQREQILEARDYVLIQLEEITSHTDVAAIFAPKRHRRASASEAYLFDSRIPMLTERDFGITGTVLQRDGGFRRRVLDRLGLIEVNRRIEFRLGENVPPADTYKWKVKNDNGSAQPRGEITDHRTLRDPEETKYNGTHYVECFAVKDGACIGRSRQNVVLNWMGGR